MIPERFRYARPESAEDAVALLADEPGTSRILGGGTWVVPELGRGEAQADLVVDLRRAGLARIARENGHVHVGATTSYADLLASELIAERLPLFRLVAAGITGGRAIQHQGTVGGSIMAARPQSDVPAAAVALSGEAIVAGPAGRRRLPVADVITGAMSTSLAANEVLVGVDFPLGDPGAVGYYKLKRGASSWPIVTAAALVRLDGDGRCAAVELVLGGVGRTPTRVDVADLLVGEAPSATLLDAAAARAREAVDEPWEDVLAPADYRLAVAAPVARRALTMAVHDATGAEGGAER